MQALDLTRVAAFAALPPRDLTVVARAARIGQYPHGACLFRAGDPCPDAIVVLEGFVRRFRLSPDDLTITTGIVRPGGLASLAPLRGATACDRHAEALGRVRTIELPLPALFALGQRAPHLLAPLARDLIAHLDRAYAELAAGAGAGVAARLLAVLRHLISAGADGGADTARPVAIRLSHADLARLTSADRATVTRCLRTLAARGLVRLERGHVVGVAPAGAERLGPPP